MFKWVFMIDPVPASRPRMTRSGHAYTAEPYRSFKDTLSNMMKLEWSQPLITNPVFVDIDVYVQRPKTTKLQYPRPDVDNYAKAVLDSMTGTILEDDKSVIALHITKQWTKSCSDEGYIVVKLSD